MLTGLRVSNIALIEDAEMDFSTGLTVLSGETGTGKTALLSALKLLIGERADSYMIREGAQAATVEGTFSFGGKTMVVRRRFGVDGRSRCWIDGEQVNVAVLSQTVGPLVDLHGQHEHQVLLSPASHLQFLDDWIGDAVLDAGQAYRSAFNARAHAEKDYRDLRRALQATQQDREVARFVIQEIETANPVKGEYEELQNSLPALQHAEALALAANSAYEALYGQSGAQEQLSAARGVLDRNVGIDKTLDAFSERLSDILTEATDIAAGLRDYRDGMEFDPLFLEGKLDRLGILDGLCKKYGPRMEDVFERWESARKTVELADSSHENLAAAEAALDTAEAVLTACGEVLANVRADKADEFSAALSAAVSSLGMENASLMVAISDLPRSAWTLDGTQHVELLYSPGTAVNPRPLAKIASGGELSRVMLALKGSLASHGAEVTLVFDEVDTGIGGNTANLVADRLVQLAESHQVIVVTHLPQIAALADTQIVVTKLNGFDIPKTLLVSVAGEARVREIARMLSGSTDGASLEHARKLLCLDA